MNSLKIGLAQMTSVDDEGENLKQILSLLEQSLEHKPNLVCFPENSLFFQISPESNSRLTMQSSEIGELDSWVKARGISVLLGGVPLVTESKHINATLFLSPGREPEIVYKKIHLFDVVVGDFSFKESFAFQGGLEPSILDFQGWRIGLSICYDLRFAELYYLYAQNDVDVLFVPSAFTAKTGEAHWHPLLRARAIENQAYVLAPAQSGKHLNAQGKGQRTTYGHSLGVDPWGEVLVDLENQSPALSFIELKKESLNKIRTQMPMKEHRVLDLKTAKAVDR